MEMYEIAQGVPWNPLRTSQFVEFQTPIRGEPAIPNRNVRDTWPIIQWVETSDPTAYQYRIPLSNWSGGSENPLEMHNRHEIWPVFIQEWPKGPQVPFSGAKSLKENMGAKNSEGKPDRHIFSGCGKDGGLSARRTPGRRAMGMPENEPPCPACKGFVSVATSTKVSVCQKAFVREVRVGGSKFWQGSIARGREGIPKVSITLGKPDRHIFSGCGKDGGLSARRTPGRRAMGMPENEPNMSRQTMASPMAHRPWPSANPKEKRLHGIQDSTPRTSNA
ncbi:hypothetical protein DFH06DRAFT_1139258 [Mycena polygramma]|nr:hypothetical protein DFH06DRAFT_1139258 [Mycena polygramma]